MNGHPHARVHTAVCPHPSVTHAPPTLARPCQDRGLDCDTVCPLNTHSWESLSGRCNAALSFPSRQLSLVPMILPSEGPSSINPAQPDTQDGILDCSPHS